ncbi:uncharacterized protein LOC143891193 [Tasmannia lanceolata]|uniref:uncharacterized protein LOC143891193 n=1 Tax=Tasmannia lanceolata TaxID=3420 RepID=UPI004064B82F
MRQGMETSADDGKGKYAVDEGKGKNASWTSDMDLVLLQALRHEAIEGGKFPNGFKKSAYKYALLEVNQACGTDLTFEQVKNYVKTMKANYRIVAEMLATSGFGWDEEKKKIVVTRDVAMEYLKSYPNRKRYFSQRHDFYEEMAEIFGDEYAHGTYKKTNKNVMRPSKEEAYVVNVANEESEYTEHTSSQFDFIGTGSQYDDMPSYIPTEEMPQVPSPRRTSPPEVGQRSQRTPTRTPMETSAAAGGSQSVASSKRKKRGVSDMKECVLDFTQSVKDMASALHARNEKADIQCQKVMEALQKIEGLDRGDICDIYDYLVVNGKEGRGFLNRPKDMRVLFVNKFLHRRSTVRHSSDYGF